MKKIICILCSIAILLSMSTVCFAAEAPALESSDPFTSIEHTSPEYPISPYYLYQEFKTPAGQYTAVEECVVSQGETELYIDTCTWYPANTIRIGFYHLTEQRFFFVEFSGGSIKEFTITTENVPDGSYLIIIENRGTMGIGSGLMYFELRN